VGIGLRMENRFYKGTELFLGEFTEIFSTPFAAGLTVATYMVVGLTFIGVISMALNRYFSRKVTFVSLMIMYAFMFLWMKVPLFHKVPILFMNQYFVFHHNWENRYFLVSHIMVMIIVLWGLRHVIRKYGVATLQFNGFSKKGLIFYYARTILSEKNMIKMGSILLLIVTYKIFSLQSMQGITFNDFILLFFYGLGSGGFHPIAFMEMLIINCMPIYFISIFFQQLEGNQQFEIMIRMQSKLRWLQAIFINVSFLLIIYSLMLFLILGTVGLLLRLQINEFSMFEHEAISSVKLLLQIVLLKILDISFQTALFCVLWLWNRKPVVAFFAIFVLQFLTFIPATVYLPVVLSNMSNSVLLVDDGGLEVLTSIIVASLLSALLALYIRINGYKKYFD